MLPCPPRSQSVVIMDEHELDALCLQVASMARHLFVEVVGRGQCERELELTDESTGVSMFMNLSALCRSYARHHRNRDDDDDDDDDENARFKLIVGGDPARLQRMAPETLRHTASYYRVRSIGFEATVESTAFPGEEDHLWSLTFHRLPSNFLSLQVALLDQLICDYFSPLSDDEYEVYDRSHSPHPPPPPESFWAPPDAYNDPGSPHADHAEHVYDAPDSPHARYVHDDPGSPHAEHAEHVYDAPGSPRAQHVFDDSEYPPSSHPRSFATKPRYPRERGRGHGG